MAIPAGSNGHDGGIAAAHSPSAHSRSAACANGRIRPPTRTILPPAPAHRTPMNCPGRRHRQRMHVRSFPRRPRETSRQINLICARLLMSPENPAAAPNGGSGSRSVGQRKSRNVARHPIRLTAVSLPTLRGTQWSSARPQEHADRAVLCSVQVHDARPLSGPGIVNWSPGALIALRPSRLAASPASRPAAARGPAAWHGSICVETRSGGLPGAL